MENLDENSSKSSSQSSPAQCKALCETLLGRGRMRLAVKISKMWLKDKIGI